jgi:hypothetical protein
MDFYILNILKKVHLDKHFIFVKRKKTTIKNDLHP